MNILTERHSTLSSRGNHQGKGNALLLPVWSQVGKREGLLHCQERLGGLLKYYYREAA